MFVSQWVWGDVTSFVVCSDFVSRSILLFNLIWVDDVIFLIPPSAFFLPNSRITWLLCDFHGSFGVQLRFILGALVVYVGLHGGLRGGENIPNRKLFGWGYFLRPCWCYVGPILGNLGSNLLSWSGFLIFLLVVLLRTPWTLHFIAIRLLAAAWNIESLWMGTIHFIYNYIPL